VTPLAALIARIIRERGPLDLGAYMTLALQHPRHGYYATRDPFGLAGDFVTAPEISQVFGELLGLALAQAWRDQGAPGKVRLVELGPGRGTLMADAWRATARVPGFHAAARLHLVETSPLLRRLQAERLGEVGASWHDELAEVPDDAPLLLVANELLDALPIRQLERRRDGWHERLVTLGPDDGLALVTAPDRSPLNALMMARHAAAPIGAIVELSPAREALATGIAGRLARHGGIALLIDYGAARLDGPTLQAVRRHARADPLRDPGEVDICSHIDFGALAGAAEVAGAHAFGPLPQGEFLARLGARQRLARLVEGQPAERAAELAAGVERLLDPAGMGAIFKALALTRPGTVPPGFAPEERWLG
jgi:NADH dehydrogenase [ubiquinone] 1 alpha subcomplex assembly factor 7